MVQQIKTSFSIIGDPIGKPRMTQRDVWDKRKAVMKYRDWCDNARETAGLEPMQKIDANSFFGVIAFAHFRIPKSYSKKKREAIAGKLCTVKPDTDNVLKAICDALFENDERLSIMQCYKYWSYDDEEPRVDIFFLQKDDMKI